MGKFNKKDKKFQNALAKKNKKSSQKKKNGNIRPLNKMDGNGSSNGFSNGSSNESSKEDNSKKNKGSSGGLRSSGWNNQKKFVNVTPGNGNN
eukprot:scaffold15978_cov43-Attheya_sp.AAC.3